MDSWGTQDMQQSKDHAPRGVRAVPGWQGPAAGSWRHLVGPQRQSEQHQPAGRSPVGEQLVLVEGSALARDSTRAPAGSPHLGHSGLSASITLAAQALQQHWCTLHTLPCEDSCPHEVWVVTWACLLMMRMSCHKPPAGQGTCRLCRTL